MFGKMAPKAVSGFVAFALAATMCPAAGLAFAAEGGSSQQATSIDSTTETGTGAGSADRVSEDVALDTSGGAGSSSDGSADAGPSGDEGSQTESSASSGASKYTSSSADRVSADVSLSGDATVGTIEYNGLAYTINEDEPATVSVTGLAISKPAGDIQVPEQIASGDKLYTVTSIKASGVPEGSNPYAEDLFDDKAKALSVSTISLPATVKGADPAFFQLFPNLTDIYVASGNEAYTSYDGALYSADKTQLILVPQGKGSLVLPNEVASVPAYVFSQSTKLSAISFSGSTGNDFLAVKNNILYTSDYSTLLAAPAGLGASASIAPEAKTIAEGAFFGNPVLETIVVSGAVSEIAKAGDTALDASGSALMTGSAVAGSTLPAFSEQTVASATVVINVAAEGDEAAALIERAKAAWEAYGFTSFKEPAKPGTEAAPAEGASGFAFTLLPDYTLAVRWEGTAEPPAALDIPDYGIIDGVQYTVSTIADNAFSNYTSIITVDLPQTVTVIGSSAFELCTNLQTIHFDSVVSIGAQAFANTALLSLVLPTTVQSIGDNAFSNMKGTDIVALGSIADSSPIALGAASGLNVYVPMGTEGAWDAGIPTLGNHIYPYGVKLSQEPFELEVGETANIADGGYIEAPGAIETNYSYKANPVSINTEDGTIEAKQAGSTYISISLDLVIDQVAIKRQSSTVTKLKPIAADGEEESGMVSVPQTISLAADTMSAVAYAAAVSNANVSASLAAETASPKSNVMGEGEKIEGGRGYIYKNKANLGFDSSVNAYMPFIWWQFTGSVTWTGGTEDEAGSGSIVTVNVEEYFPGIDYLLTPDLIQDKATTAWGMDATKERLSGFKNLDTGSFISVEMLCSGKPFTFSFVMSDPYGTPGLIYGTAQQRQNRVNKYGVVWHGVKTRFEPVFESLDADQIGIRFHPNDGIYTGIGGKTTGSDSWSGTNRNHTPLVFSRIGETPQTPQAPLVRDGYTFLGWYTERDGGQLMPDKVTLDMAGKIYYAHWGKASGSFTYTEDASFGFDTSYRKAFAFMWDRFKGSASWTGGTADGPAKGSVVTVKVDEYVPRLDYVLTEDLMRRTAVQQPNGWGGDGQTQRLIGFRERNTGSFLSVETLYSGGGFTFSYVMPEPETRICVTKTAVVWENASIVSTFDPCFETLNNEVGIYFHPNDGVWTGPSGFNSISPEIYHGGTNRNWEAFTYSVVGDTLATPQAPLTRDGYVFLGWFTEKNGGELAPEKVSADMACTTLYAHWGTKTHTIEYTDGNFAFDTSIRAGYAFMYYKFSGSASWTGGTAEGPAEGSVVSVKVDEYIPRIDYALTEDLLQRAAVNAWGGDEKTKRLTGFRDSNTGSFISVSTLFSGGGFTFSFVMPAPEARIYVNNKGVVWESASKPSTMVPCYESLTNEGGIFFHPNDGVFKGLGGLTSISPEVHPYGTNRNRPALVFSKIGDNLQTPRASLLRDGYVFLGWYTAADGGQLAPEVVTPDMIGKTYYARWGVSSGSYYLVQYDGNGADNGAVNSCMLQNGVDGTLAQNGYTRIGYTFIGWNTNADGNGAAYQAGQKVRDIAGTNNRVTLYAQWDPIAYNITYERAGGLEIGAANPTTYTIEQTVILKDVAKTGYTFIGWRSSDDEEANPVKNLTIERGNTGDKAFTACFSLTPCSLSFAPNDGMGTVANVDFTIEDDSLTVPAGDIMTRLGYTFGRWNSSADGSGVTYDGLQVLNGSDAIGKLISDNAGRFVEIDGRQTLPLYAQWDANSYDLLYNVGPVDGSNSVIGGSTASQSGLKYTDTVTFNGNGFTNLGYTFTKWDVKAGTAGITSAGMWDQSSQNVKVSDIVSRANANGQSVTNEPSGNAINLYANWSPNQYAIEYAIGEDEQGSAPIDDIALPGKIEFVYSDLFRGGGISLEANMGNTLGYANTGWSLTNSIDSSKDEPSLDLPSAIRITKANFTSCFNGYKSSEVITLSGRWVQKDITVAYDKNGPASGEQPAYTSSGQKRETTKYRAAISLPAIPADANISYEGYGISGWLPNAGSTDQISAATMGDVLKAVYDNGGLSDDQKNALVDSSKPSITIYAKWGEGQTTFTIKYVLQSKDDGGYNEGTAIVGITNSDKSTGDTVKIEDFRATSYSSDGYTYIPVERVGSGVSDSGDKTLVGTASENVWKVYYKLQLSVSFAPGSQGAGDMVTKTDVDWGDTVSQAGFDLSGIRPSEELAYTQSGWKAADGTDIGLDAIETAVLNDNVSYTAVWDALRYKFIYTTDGKVQGNTAMPDAVTAAGGYRYFDLVPENEGDTVSSPFPNATDAVGYTFAGWAKRGTSSPVYASGTKLSSRDAFKALFNAAPGSSEDDRTVELVNSSADNVYEIRFYKYVDLAESSKVSPKVSYSGTTSGTIVDSFDLLSAGDLKDADKRSRYVLKAWAMDGTRLAGAAGAKVVIGDVLNGVEVQPAASGDDVGKRLIKVYATWAAMYQLSVPTDQATVNVDLSTREAQTGETTPVKIVNESPYSVTIGARSAANKENTRFVFYNDLSQAQADAYLSDMTFSWKDADFAFDAESTAGNGDVSFMDVLATGGAASDTLKLAFTDNAWAEAQKSLIDHHTGGTDLTNKPVARITWYIEMVDDSGTGIPGTSLDVALSDLWQWDSSASTAPTKR